MTGAVFTPADSGLDPFTLRRRPDNLNARSVDFGNRAVLTAGAVAAVLDKDPRIRGQVLRFSMLTQADRDALEAYIDDVLDHSTEMFHLQWEPTVNLLTETRRLDLITPNGPWQLAASSTFIDVSLGEEDRFGGLLAARLEFLGGASGTNQRIIQTAGFNASGGVAYSSGLWVKLVEGASITDALQLETRTNEELNTLTLTPTSSWTFHATTAAPFTLGLTSLAWRFKRNDSPAPGTDFAVAVMHPQLIVGQATPSTYQHVERELGMSRLHLDGPLRWRGRHDGLFDLELSVIAVGGV